MGVDRHLNRCPCCHNEYAFRTKREATDHWKRNDFQRHVATDDLYAACRAWAELGHCANGRKARDDCACDWHMVRRAVAKADGKVR